MDFVVIVVVQHASGRRVEGTAGWMFVGWRFLCCSDSHRLSSPANHLTPPRRVEDFRRMSTRDRKVICCSKRWGIKGLD